MSTYFSITNNFPGKKSKILYLYRKINFLYKLGILKNQVLFYT